jgi:bifunctional non-homologous end joining protein LigD
MLLLRTESLPEGPAWSYELKLDGYRALAVKTAGKIRLRSRNDKDFNIRYPGVVRGIANLPDETVLDGEVVALDESGRPSFNALQNFGSATAPVFYYVFDVLVLAGRDAPERELDELRRLTPSQHQP